ncbi:toxin 50 [Clostridium cavendishii DSM 21758]|uniref:Toxin 50 n=1 Tax=Clostridium cavendishii DSM 21758 TaxID=1121302 RepID=A0A1M6RRU7_9CLOT|nr:polymorphic toxin type 50 domain-containing protein [Clostridium cavendishii]SHK35114.1 toxin 50 [Clostridium cavendishii DSM 21758]
MILILKGEIKIYNKLKHFTFVFTIFFFISLIGTYTLPTQFNNKYIGENKEAQANPAALAPELAPVPVIGEILMIATLGYAVAHQDNTESMKAIDAFQKHDFKEFSRISMEQSKPVDLSADFRAKVYDGLCSSTTFMQNTFYDVKTQTIYMTQDAIQALKKTYHNITDSISISPGIPSNFDLTKLVNTTGLQPFIGGHTDYGNVIIFVNPVDVISVNSTPNNGISVVLKEGAPYCFPSSGSTVFPVILSSSSISYYNPKYPFSNIYGCPSIPNFGSNTTPSICYDPTIQKGIDALPNTGSIAIPFNPSLNDYARNTSVHFPNINDIALPKSVQAIPSTAIPLDRVKDNTFEDAFPKIDDICSPTEEAQENIKPTTDSLTVQRYINGRPVVINQSLQDAHIKGTKAYEADIAKGITRSLLTEDASELLDYYSGTGYKINDYTELVDFQYTIGQYYDASKKTFMDTTMGVIIYGVNGAHIIPANTDSNPKKDTEETRPNFKTEELLKEHYDKHVVDQKEFGNITEKEYLEGAQDIVKSKGENTILKKKRKNGDELLYKESANEFVAQDRLGNIKTYFKPKDGINYYNKM